MFEVLIIVGGFLAIGSLTFLCGRLGYHKDQAEKWEGRYASKSSDYSKLLLEHQGCGIKLVREIEARLGSEDATNILASVLCDLVRKKRSKKKG